MTQEHRPHPREDASHEDLMAWEKAQAEIRGEESTQAGDREVQLAQIGADKEIGLAGALTRRQRLYRAWLVRSAIGLAAVGGWIWQIEEITRLIIRDDLARENIELFIAWVGVLGAVVFWLRPWVVPKDEDEG